MIIYPTHSRISLTFVSPEASWKNGQMDGWCRCTLMAQALNCTYILLESPCLVLIVLLSIQQHSGRPHGATREKRILRPLDNSCILISLLVPFPGRSHVHRHVHHRTTIVYRSRTIYPSRLVCNCVPPVDNDHRLNSVLRHTILHFSRPRQPVFNCVGTVLMIHIPPDLFRAARDEPRCSECWN